MGFFSWRTSDTQESISNAFSKRGALPVKMLDDKGNVWIELNYEGYGKFGGKCFYELLAEMNNLPSRDSAINLEYSPDIKPPKLVTINCNIEYDQLPKSKRCITQGYFYN